MIKKTGNYIYNHYAACIQALKALSAKPLASSLTILVLAVSLSLPLCFWIVLKNAKVISNQWQHATQLSIFLKKSITQEQQQAVVDKLASMNSVAYSNLISSEEGLLQLQEITEAPIDLSQLPNNPLPVIIEVFPTSQLAPSEISVLQEKLQRLAGVDFVKVDMEWVQRLHAFIALFERVLWAVMVILGIAVILITSNTIRLLVQNRQEEIKVLKLVGATRYFIIRPFVYQGIIMGAVGSLGACLIVFLLGMGLHSVLNELGGLYQNQLFPYGLKWSMVPVLLLFGVGLGFFGARFTVNQQIKRS